MPTDATPTRKLRDLQRHEHNVRLDDSVDVVDLAASISSVGLLTPITVQRGTSTIIAGHRRFSALSHLADQGELTPDFDVPVYEIDLEADDATVEMLVENLQRVDLTPVEEASGFDLLRSQGLKQKEIATKIGKSPSLVSARLRLLKLPDAILGMVHDGSLEVTLATELCALVHREDYMKYVIESDGLISASLVEKWIEQDLRDATLRRALKWVREAGGEPITEYNDLRAVNKIIAHGTQFSVDSADEASIAVAEGGTMLWLALKYDGTVAAFAVTDAPESLAERTETVTERQEEMKRIGDAKKQRNAALADAINTSTMTKSEIEGFLMPLLVALISGHVLQVAARYLHLEFEEVDDLESQLVTLLASNNVASRRCLLALVAAQLESFHGTMNPPDENAPITGLAYALGIELDDDGAPLNYDSETTEGPSDDDDE